VENADRCAPGHDARALEETEEKSAKTTEETEFTNGATELTEDERRQNRLVALALEL